MEAHNGHKYNMRHLRESELMHTRRELFEQSFRVAVMAGVGLVCGQLLDPPHAEAAEAVRYINRDLTTGNNDGTSAANAFRGVNALERCRAATSGSTVDRFVFAAGGIYREAFSTVSTRVKTDISFTASTRTITAASSNFTTLGFQVGDIIRVSGSVSNDGQLTVATVGTTTMTVSSTNSLNDENAGAGINITDLVRGSNLAALDPGANGSASRPRRWQLNGAEISAGLPLNTANGYTWTQSAANPGEWYVRRSDGSNPSLVPVFSGTHNGEFVCDAADLGPDMGTVGALSPTAPWGWGDGDSLGYSTLYVRADVNPESLNIVACQLASCVTTSWEYHSWEDAVFSYANKITGFTSGMAVRNGGANQWWAKRCLVKYCTFHGFEGGKFRIESCLTYFTGHRGYAQAGSGAMDIFNCVDYGSHLFLLIGTGSTGTITVRNCISAYNEAGAINKQAAGATLIEDHNIWYPRFGASGATLGYVNTANWLTTAASDYPPSAATTISTIAANEAAGAVDPLFTSPSLTSVQAGDFKLRLSSVARYSGRPVFFARDFAGRRFSLPHPSRGIYEFVSGNPAGARALR